MITKEQLLDQGVVNPEIIEAPPGAIDRLTKALEKAKVEGRGKRGIADITITFFNADSPFPGTRNTQTYAFIEAGNGSFTSGYALWQPQGPADDPGVIAYDCYAVANEINAL